MSNQVNLNLYWMLVKFRFNKENPKIILYLVCPCKYLMYHFETWNHLYRLLPFFFKKTIRSSPSPLFCGETQGQYRVTWKLLVMPMLLKSACYFLWSEVSIGSWSCSNIFLYNFGAYYCSVIDSSTFLCPYHIISIPAASPDFVSLTEIAVLCIHWST